MAAQSNTHSCNVLAIPALIFWAACAIVWYVQLLWLLKLLDCSNHKLYRVYIPLAKTDLSHHKSESNFQPNLSTILLWTLAFVQFPHSIMWQWTLHIWQNQNPHSVFMASKNVDTPTTICIKLFTVCTANCNGHSQLMSPYLLLHPKMNNTYTYGALGLKLDRSI